MYCGEPNGVSMLILLLACDNPAEVIDEVTEEPAAVVPAPPSPPDPCRHSVLEQLSPTGLDAMQGDETCLKRVEMWKVSGRMWAASADLDGDEKSENIVLLARSSALTEPTPHCPPEGCMATLIAGDSAVDLEFHWPNGEHFGEKEMKLVDINTADNRQEVLIRQLQAESEDPSHVSHIFTFADNQLTESRLEAGGYNQGTLTLTGDGRVGIEDSDCAHKKITWHRLEGAVLKPDSEDITLQPNAEQFKLPDGSYGCPG